MDKVKSYEDLLVYQKSDELAFQIYQLLENFPKAELYGMIAQLKRSIVSVPANIVEGSVRKGAKEFVRFLYISLSSLAESEYYIKFSFRLGYISEEQKSDTLSKMDEVGRMLRGLIKSLTLKTSH